MGRGVKLRDENGVGWGIKEALYADERVLVAETREHLHLTESEFERTCDGMRLKINVGNSKLLGVRKDQKGSVKNLRVRGGEMQEVDKFK